MRSDTFRLHEFSCTETGDDDISLLSLGMNKISKRKRNTVEIPTPIKSQISEDMTVKQEITKISCMDIMLMNDVASDDEWSYI